MGIDDCAAARSTSSSARYTRIYLCLPPGRYRSGIDSQNSGRFAALHPVGIFFPLLLVFCRHKNYRVPTHSSQSTVLITFRAALNPLAHCFAFRSADQRRNTSPFYRKTMKGCADRDSSGRARWADICRNTRPSGTKGADDKLSRSPDCFCSARRESNSGNIRWNQQKIDLHIKFNVQLFFFFFAAFGIHKLFTAFRSKHFYECAKHG